jgi:hypothetical protein
MNKTILLITNIILLYIFICTLSYLVDAINDNYVLGWNIMAGLVLLLLNLIPDKKHVK